MKQLWSIMFFLLGSLTLLAQEQENIALGSLSPWNLTEEGKKTTCFTAVTDGNVRDKPNTSGVSVAKLPIASKVTIESITTDTTTLNGYTAPWCKVSYSLAGKNQTGYIWGGILASVAYEVKDEYDEARKGLIYVAGVSSVTGKDEKKWNIHIRAVRNGVELAKTEISLLADIGYYAQIKNLGSLGFNNAIDAIDYNCNYPACGYASISNLIVFTGKKLSPVLEITNISDGGVFYSSEDYLLPSDKGGIQNHVILIKSSAEFEEKENKKGDYEQVLNKQDYSIQLYKWTGDKLQKIKELK